MTRLWNFLKNDNGPNLGEKITIYPQVLTFFRNFNAVVLQRTAIKWTKVKNARAGRGQLSFLPSKYANL